MNLKLRSLEIFRLFSQTENVTETARRLGMTRSQVNYWLRGQRGASSQLA